MPLQDIRELAGQSFRTGTDQFGALLGSFAVAENARELREPGGRKFPDQLRKVGASRIGSEVAYGFEERTIGFAAEGVALPARDPGAVFPCEGSNEAVYQCRLSGPRFAADEANRPAAAPGLGQGRLQNPEFIGAAGAYDAPSVTQVCLLILSIGVDDLDVPNEAISALSDRLDEKRGFGTVAERMAQLADALPVCVLIAVRLAPNRFAQRVATDHAAAVFDEIAKKGGCFGTQLQNR
jgi:hypothetical protein